MKNQYRIGRGKECDIVLRGESCLGLHASIRSERGHWLLTNLEPTKSIYVNGKKVDGPTRLSKYDVIKVCDQTINWSNYLYEGDKQELTKKDFLTYSGRISRSNFRVLSLLASGLGFGVFFSPGLLAAVICYRKSSGWCSDKIGLIQQLAPFAHSIGFSFLVSIYLLLAIKRMRDTDRPIWILLMPIYNLYLLYFGRSKE